VRKSFGSRRRRALGAVLALALFAGACGDDGDTAGPDEPDNGGITDAGDIDEGEPQYGGSVVYALEAETSGGYCLPEAQLAIAGIQVTRTIYDTLTAPDENGEIQPFLAESVEANDDATEFTITLRDGIEFHDGTPLDAEVVKNNLDAYRGQYEGRSPLLFVFVFSNVTSVDVVDDLTLTVSTETPWPAFPWFLWGSARVGIMAQAQLDDAETCDRNLIGTGPFVQQEWTVNQRFVATRNESYWDTDENGNQLPFLDRIEYRPINEGPQRVNALDGGEAQLIHTSGAITIDSLRSLGDQIGLIESDAFGEVGYFMLNSDPGGDDREPRIFSSQTARLAAAHALDRERINNVRGLGIPTVASGPFAPGNIGHLDDTGYPEYDPELAAQLVEQFEEEEGRPFEIVLSNTTDPDTVATGDLLEELLTDVGITVRRNQFEQAQLINTALAGDFDMVQWRNHPGADPDTQYNWWATGSPVNFGRITDPDMQDLLDRGRTTIDEDERAEIYEDLNRLFAEQAYNLWQSWTIWAIGSDPAVRGILGPNLPDGGGPFPGLGTGHPVSSIWLDG
jgi:peptide/nickel transport system substrate-binding protein